jgi:intein/homing endonuclease
MDFTQLDLSYFLGFIFADGTLYSQPNSNKGSMKIELSRLDRSLLERLQELIPCYSSIGDRDRETNFGPSQNSVLRTYDYEFRTILKAAGLPVGRKSDSVELPIVPFSKLDFFRGFIDGDGSVGITAKGLPFVSLVTKSEKNGDKLLRIHFRSNRHQTIIKAEQTR